MKALYPQLTISKGSIYWLLLCLIISISWHIPHTPIWVLVAVFFIANWRFRLVNSQGALPSKTFRFFLTVTAFIGILVTYHSFLGRDPGITALILLSTLKLLELNSQRDFMFIIFLCYFLGDDAYIYL